MEELQAFMGGSQDIFAVEREPLRETLSCPAPLRTLQGKKFWRIDSPLSVTPVPLHESGDRDEYRRCIHELANEIAQRLDQLRTYRSNTGAQSNTVKNSSGDARVICRRVLLTQVTEDLDGDRHDLKTYLEQFLVPVTEKNYPQGGDSFREAFEADLEGADLVVQLLSQVPGRHPADLPLGYARAQYESAAAKGVEILQWRRADLNLNDVSDAQHRELLRGAIAMTFESFKAEVVRRVTEKPVAWKATLPSSAFINADRPDADIAEQIQDELCKRNFTVFHRIFDGSPQEIREDLESRLQECDVLIIVYGKTGRGWVRAQFGKLSKVRGDRREEIRGVALYIGPPPQKPAHRVAYPRLIEIDSRDAVTAESLRRLIEALASP